jgi:hypothetical protein
MKTTAQLFEGYALKKQNKPTSRRAYLIQAIADTLGVPFMNVFKEVWHLKGEAGCDVLQIILDDTLRSSDRIEWRALKCRELIQKSK